MPDFSALLRLDPLPVLVIVIDQQTNQVLSARLETLETSAALADLANSSEPAQDHKGEPPSCSRKSSQ